MMWKEFEELAGYEVSADTYNNIIEPMYMALKDVDKRTFIAMLDKKAFALPTAKSYLRIVKKEAEHQYDMVCRGHSGDWHSRERMEKAAKDYLRRKYGIIWSQDPEAFCYFTDGYLFVPGRGCPYPKELVIGRGNYEYERITLVKED